MTKLFAAILAGAALAPCAASAQQAAPQTLPNVEIVAPAQTAPNAPAAGMKFTAEVLDTWNMTLTPVEGVFTLKKKDNFSFADKDGRPIALPGRPYMAIRIKRVSE